MIERIERRAIAVVAVVAIAAYGWLNTRPDADPPIRADGFNYYLYAPSWLVYHDISLDALSNDWYGGAYPDFAGMLRWPGTDHWVNRMPIGVSMMMLPFIVAADALTRWSNFPRDGFSFYYQHAAGLAGLAYFLAGLAILRSMLRRRFSPGVTLATLVVLTFGTDLFHYAVYDATFSHAFSFALVSALVWLADRWWIQPSTRAALGIGFVAALIVLVRHTNGLLLLIVPLWHVDRWRELWPRRNGLLVMTLAGAVCLTPQLAYYKWATGEWIVNPYAVQGLRMTPLAPHLFGVLLSPQRGLFFWAPVLACAVAGWVVADRWARDVRAGAAVVLVANAWIIASWSEWQYGASFGHRAFIDSFPIAAIFLASCFAWVSARPRLLPVVAGCAGLATLLSIAQMIQYWLHVWPARDITWEQYRALFLTFQ